MDSIATFEKNFAKDGLTPSFNRLGGNKTVSKVCRFGAEHRLPPLLRHIAPGARVSRDKAGAHCHGNIEVVPT